MFPWTVTKNGTEWFFFFFFSLFILSFLSFLFFCLEESGNLISTDLHFSSVCLGSRHHWREFWKINRMCQHIQNVSLTWLSAHTSFEHWSHATFPCKESLKIASSKQSQGAWCSPAPCQPWALLPSTGKPTLSLLRQPSQATRSDNQWQVSRPIINLKETDRHI